MRYFRRCLICGDLLEASLPSRVVALHSTMTHGCTSGRLACMTRVCAKG
jgi:hypothetical protein